MNTCSFRQDEKYHWIWLIILFLGSILLNSCVTTGKTTYLQEYRNSEYDGEYVPPDDYLIQPNDNLYIRVATPDSRWSDIFNPTFGTGGGGALGGNASIQLISYLVQQNGNVDLPYIGEVLVAGKTLDEAKSSIEIIMLDYISDASITVRLVGNYVTLVGEVRAPGMYEMTKERLNIFQAIAMAGDVADYGNRYEVSIIRQTLQGSKTKEFDITDKKIIDSEYFYVYPNDVIYVKSMKGKFFGLTQYPYGTLISTLSTAAALFVLIQNQILFRNQQ